MAARGIAIADAWVQWVNAQNWPPVADPAGNPEGWTLSRLWAPDATLASLGDAPLVEAVAMTAGAAELIFRGMVKQRFITAAAVRQRYSAAGEVPVAWYDARAELVEAIANATRGLVLTDYPDWPAGSKAACESAEIDDVTSFQDVQEAKAFVATIAIEWFDYRVSP